MKNSSTPVRSSVSALVIALALGWVPVASLAQQAPKVETGRAQPSVSGPDGGAAGLGG